MLRVIVGSDHGGIVLKEAILSFLNCLIEYVDVGCYSALAVDYPDYAKMVANRVSCGEFPLGILFCGTGIGMSIAANKVKRIRCAVVNDLFSAR